MRDKNAQMLYMDFSNIKVPMGKPSDIDFFYVVPELLDKQIGGFAIFAEIKHEWGQLQETQEYLYERFVENYKAGAVAFFVTHNKRWQDGDTEVDVSQCKVQRYYYRHAWHKPQEELLFVEAITKILAFERMQKKE